MSLPRRVIGGHERSQMSLTLISRNSPLKRSIRDLSKRHTDRGDSSPNQPRRQADKKDAENSDPIANCADSTASFNHLIMSLPKGSKAIVLRIIERMRGRVLMDHTTYNLLIEKVVDLGDDFAFQIYSDMREEAQREDSSVRPDLTTFSLLVRACERNGDFARAFALYNEMKEMFSLFPDVSLYNTLIGFCVATKNEDMASSIFDEMKQRGVQSNVHTYNAMMSVFSEAPCELIYQMFEEMTKNRIRPNRRTYNTLIRTCQRVDDYEKAFEFYDEMKKEGVQPDVVTYNVLIEMCRERLDYFERTQSATQTKRSKIQRDHGVAAIGELSLSLFKEMQDTGIQPNTFSYNSLLGVLSRCGSDMKVFDTFKAMKEEMSTNDPRTMLPVAYVDRKVPQWLLESRDMEILQGKTALFEDPVADQGRISCKGVKADLLTYSTMIQASVRRSMPDRAFAFFEEMKDEARITPDTDVYVLMMDVCVISKDKRKAFSLFEEAKGKGAHPDIKLCNALMNVLAELGDEQIFETFEEIRTGKIGMNVRPSQDTYNLLMKACVVSKNTDRALALYKEMIGKTCPIKPDTVTYNILMDICAINRDIVTVRSLVLDMRRRDVPATITTYNKMMNVFVEAMDPGIVEIFDDIRKNGPQPNLTTYCILLGFYLKKQDEAILYLFEDIRKAGIEPDIQVYNVMLSYCALTKDKRRAGKYFDEITARNLPPDIDTYNAFLGCLAETGEETVFYIFKDMMEKGIQPTPKTFSILGKHKKGMDCLKKAGSRRMLFPSVK